MKEQKWKDIKKIANRKCYDAAKLVATKQKSSASTISSSSSSDSE